MRPAAAAREYARALCGVAGPGAAAAVEALAATARVLEAEPRVRALARHPGIPASERSAALLRMARVPGDGLAASLVRLLVRRRSAELLPAIAAQARRILQRRAGVTEARVTSAAELSAAAQARLAAALSRWAGGRVEVTFGRDPGLLGGLAIQVGEVTLDNTLSRELGALADHLVQAMYR